MDSFMACPLTLIFRKSIEEKKIPYAWWLANIYPIFKKGLVRADLMGFQIINKLIAEEQHGFVPRKGCESNLLET